MGETHSLSLTGSAGFVKYFQNLIMIPIAFIPAIVWEQAIRQTICCSVLYDTSTTFSMIGAGYFRTNTFLYIFTLHITTSFQMSIGEIALKK